MDYGWGPTAFVEYLLEHVHVYSATPWWASIILTALIVRLALLKGYIGAADVSARVATITDLQKPIKARLDAAKAARDTVAMVQATQDLRGLHRQAGIQLWKLAVPLIQVPIGYGTFRLLKGMAALPVPGLEDGGLLWIKDLTISDPYMILPATTAVAIYYTFKVRGSIASTYTNANPLAGRWGTRQYHDETRDIQICTLRDACNWRGLHAPISRMYTAHFWLHCSPVADSVVSITPAMDEGTPWYLSFTKT